MINPSNLNLSTLPSVPLEDRSRLPQSSGIYFAIALSRNRSIHRLKNLENSKMINPSDLDLSALLEKLSKLDPKL